MAARAMRIIGLQPPRPRTNTPTCSSVQIGLLKKVDSILDSTQPPPSGAHQAQVVRRCHLRPFNYAALRRSPPSETATSTKTPSHAQCSVRHNTRSSCKTAANIQRLARPSSIDGLHRPLEPVQVLAVILYLQLRVSNNVANRKRKVDSLALLYLVVISSTPRFGASSGSSTSLLCCRDCCRDKFYTLFIYGAKLSGHRSAREDGERMCGEEKT
ncbi:uncharacterized protein LOC119304269 isoform X2 [Triticum dicoccoides]|uniref:uncharacterized protein LOC119304269 isoform X2 n=1 Tax=Triticum dicoccoides TaxID=85692 RepID=UPI00188EB6CB|nr:uncharacterized protein LOC119304269 isoform X2 [Triticum dicoccoides]